LDGSRTISAEPAAMGWIIRFQLTQGVADVLEANTLILEHSCDETVKLTSSEAWESDEQQVAALMGIVPGKLVESIYVFDGGKLEIVWPEGLAFRLCPADYSMDWEWEITSADGSNQSSFSVVSVHGETIWTRYPVALDRDFADRDSAPA
jgi:hypothetical protein